MNDWDATDYAAKDNVLRVVRLEAEALFGMAEATTPGPRRPRARSGRSATSSVT